MVNGNSALYFAAAAYGIYSNKESQKYQKQQQAQKQQKLVSKDLSFLFSTEGNLKHKLIIIFQLLWLIFF